MGLRGCSGLIRTYLGSARETLSGVTSAVISLPKVSLGIRVVSQLWAVRVGSVLLRATPRTLNPDTRNVTTQTRAKRRISFLQPAGRIAKTTEAPTMGYSPSKATQYSGLHLKLRWCTWQLHAV